MVSRILQDRVVEKITECFNIATNHYDREFGLPQISYDLRGLTAGFAYFSKWRIRINPTLLKENVEDMLSNTIPHEVAHLICDEVYGPHTQAHGWQWKTVMMVLGIDPKRCHNYDTTNSRVKTNVKNKFRYKCKCREHVVGPVRHRKMLLRAAAGKVSGYRCRWCKSYLELVEALGQVTYEQARDGKKKRPTKKYRTPKKGTKMEKAINIFNRHRRISRPVVIKLFMTTLGMSKAGATTYYYNCQQQAA